MVLNILKTELVTKLYNGDQYNKIVYSTRDSFEAVATRMIDDEMQKLYERREIKAEDYYWSNKYGISIINSIGGKKYIFNYFI